MTIHTPNVLWNSGSRIVHSAESFPTLLYIFHTLRKNVEQYTHTVRNRYHTVHSLYNAVTHTFFSFRYEQRHHQACDVRSCGFYLCRMTAAVYNRYSGVSVSVSIYTVYVLTLQSEQHLYGIRFSNPHISGAVKATERERVGHRRHKGTVSVKC